MSISNTRFNRCAQVSGAMGVSMLSVGGSAGLFCRVAGAAVGSLFFRRWKFVRKHMFEIYPQLADVGIDYAWGGTLAITMRRMPHFGRKGNNVYWAQGSSGHGIAMANMGGKLVAEVIMGQAERFDLFRNLKHFPFPGGRWLRKPGLVAGMLYYAMLDRI